MALQNSEEHFRALSDNIAQLVWLGDERGKIFWMNKRFLDFTGISLEELTATRWSEVQQPEHSERVETSFQLACAKGVPWEDTFPLRRRDGVYRWFPSQAVPIRDDDGGLGLGD